MDPRFDVQRFWGRKSDIKVSHRNPYRSYKCTRVLGEGEFGTVKEYRKGRQTVAIKEFNTTDFSTRETIEKAFQKELCVYELILGPTKTERHENVLHFKHAFYTDFGYCIALEYCAGGDLSRIYNVIPDYTEVEVRDIIVQCSNGLNFLVSKGIAHRDIKDENILVKSWKPLKVCLADLNHAKQVKNMVHQTSMKTTEVGNAFYEAPELSNHALRSEEGFYSYKIDIYSLGILAYELLTFGKPMPMVVVPEEYQNNEKEFYERYNDTGLPLYPDEYFMETSDEGKVVIARMLTPLYKFRLDYDEIIGSEWAELEFEQNLKSVRTIMAPYMRSSDI